MKRLGIIGGGQLGMYLCQAAQTKGIEVVVLDPNENCSASHYCDKLLVGEYTDQYLVEKLFELCERVTYEFENIDLEVLMKVDKQKLIPRLNSLLISQDRILEKTVAQNSGLRVGRFFAVDSLADVQHYLPRLGNRAVLKTRRLGYDGKNQQILTHKTEVSSELLQVPCILEEFIVFDEELSVIGARNLEGEFKFLCANRNVHKNHCLHMSEVIADSDLGKVLKNFMEINNLYGILTMELFIKGEEIYFNELAPRPHNSGHTSMDACNISQYDLAIEALSGDRFSKVYCKPYTLVNILGMDINKFRDQKLLNANFYDYYKNDIRTGRKMGHITTNNNRCLRTILKIMEGIDE